MRNAVLLAAMGLVLQASAVSLNHIPPASGVQMSSSIAAKSRKHHKIGAKVNAKATTKNVEITAMRNQINDVSRLLF